MWQEVTNQDTESPFTFQIKNNHQQESTVLSEFENHVVVGWYPTSLLPLTSAHNMTVGLLQELRKAKTFAREDLPAKSQTGNPLNSKEC
jgi:hypothetical protein